LNNAISVGVDDPLPGLWKARVSGYNIPEGPQMYSLVFTPDSIHTPGNISALAVFDNGDLTVDPGATTAAEFWVTNVGVNYDSVQVSIFDDVGWAHSSVDTVVHLDSWDSAYFSIMVTIPAESMAGDTDVLTTNLVSLSDPLVTATRETAVIAAAVHSISLGQSVTEDTIFSPGSYEFDITVYNHGNGVNTISLIADDEAGWIYTPSNTDVTVEVDDSAVASFTASTPAEQVHLLSNTVSVTAIGAGPVEEEISFTLVVYNPLFPPELVSPESGYYSQDRTPEFSWDGEADSSVLHVASNYGMTANLLVYRGLTANTFVLPDADSLEDGWYYWGVKRYLDPDSSSLQRYPHSFGVDNLPPLPIDPDRPRDGTYLSDANVVFIFKQENTAHPPNIAPEYGIFQLARDSAFTIDVTTIQPLDTSLTYTPGAPLGLGRWYWRVWNTDDAGNDAATAPTRTFLVDTAAPAAPLLLEPADGNTLEDDTVTWRWSLPGDPPAYETAPEYFFIHISSEPDFSDWGTYTGFLAADSLRLSRSTFQEFQAYHWRVKAYDSAGLYSDFSDIWRFNLGVGICGDLNDDLIVTLSDISRLIDHVYISKLPLENPVFGNVNGSLDGNITLSDITRLIDHVYISKLPLDCPGM
jgi:hypothetical protein